MPTRKLATCLMATTAFAIAQSAGAVGLPDVSNAHTGKQLKETNDFNAALKGGTPDLILRLRYEDVSDDIPAGTPISSAADADLLSLRTALGYSTARANGFYGRIEFEATTHIGDTNAFTVGDDLTFPPGPTGSRAASGHALIADPVHEDFNEAYIGWRSASSGCHNAPGGCDGSTTVKAGRQEIIYDNHRWVGNIVWRQNYQSYDAVRIDNTSIDNLSLSYTYLSRVNRTFGEDSAFNVSDMSDSHLINIAYDTPVGKLVAYGYLLNFDDNPNTPFTEGVGVGAGVTNFDSDTYGLRFSGKYETSDAFSLTYQLEYANQNPTKDASSTLSDNNYMLFEVGGDFKIAGKDTSLSIGQEVLEGNGVNALQTPLATVHAFNGWSDKFVGAPGGTATPVGGLEDSSISLEVKGLIGKSKLVVEYHDYQANTTVSGISAYGTEWGALFAKPFTKEWLGLIKYSSFTADSSWVNSAAGGVAAGAYDTDKFWVMAQYKFD